MTPIFQIRYAPGSSRAGTLWGCPARPGQIIHDAKPARFREILRTLYWNLPTLAELLAIKVEVVQRWHDALEPVPNNVARWLQRLAKVHEEHPYPDDWFEDEPAKRATPARIVFARRPTRR